MIQVFKNHYDFKKYVKIDRFSSYFYQLNYIYGINPEKILEIGIGDNILRKILSDRYYYKTLDFDSNLNPDFVGSVDNMSVINDKSFDLVCAFQVLEHIKFENVITALKELNRVSSNFVLISIPYCSLVFKLSFKLPFFSEKKIKIQIPYFFQKHKFDGEHYWELGKKGFSRKKMSSIIKDSGFEIIDTFIPFENTYHCFYLLKKENA